MKTKLIESKSKKVEKLEPKRVQTAEGRRRAMLREMKGIKKKAA